MTEVIGFRMIIHGGTTITTLSVPKLALSCVGIWPVKKKDLFMDLRWIIAVFLEASTVKSAIYSLIAHHFYTRVINQVQLH